MNEPRYVMSVMDMGGWARVYLESGEPACELATALSNTLTGWMRKNPHLKVTHIVPISRDGDTAEFHFWYEVVHDSRVAAKRAEGNSPA